jgi:hypothetical protein
VTEDAGLPPDAVPRPGPEPSQTLESVLVDARCWGIELDPRYRVLAVTVEPDPLRVLGTPGEHQLLCFPVSTLLVSLTRPADAAQGSGPMVLLTFELDQLTAVSERLGGATIAGPILGRPEPRPGSWGPRYSLEGRSSAPDGTLTTVTLDLTGDDGVRLRLFARCDDLELRDAARTLVLSSGGIGRTTTAGEAASSTGAPGREEPNPNTRDEDPPQPLRF